MIKTQFTLYMKNRPGELARVTRAFAQEKINLEGISVAESTDVSLVQVIVSSARAARKVLKKVGIPLSEQKVVVLTMPNTPGALARIVDKLAKEKININYLYATASPGGPETDGSVVISAMDLSRLEKLFGS